MPSLKVDAQSKTYFTEGSVDPISHIAGAGFTARDSTKSKFTSSTVAIMGPLAHASTLKQPLTVYSRVCPMTSTS